MGYGSLIQRITYKISGRTATSGGLFVPSSIQYDYAVGGIPFLSATSDNRPDTEKPVQLRKQQFDNQKNPGEYSLTQWWLRSQASYVGGAGIIYQDPDTGSSQNNTRFAKSIGINPFSDNASISLLKETELCTAIGGTNLGFPYVCSQSTGPTDDTVYVARGATVETRTVTASDMTIVNTATLTTSGSTQQITGGVVPFVQTSTTSAATFPFCAVYMADLSSATNSGVWRIDKLSPTPTKLYNTLGNQNYITVGKARGLLILAQGNILYALDPYVSTTQNLPAAPNAAVPQDQIITSVTDGPDGVYVAANDGTQGYIYRSTFNSTLGTINGLQLTAVTPAGEFINDIQSYINTYLIISTSSSIRVGTFNSLYGVQYGPQLLTVPFNQPNAGQDIYGQGFGKIAIYGQLAFVATKGAAQHDGQRGLMCVNLGEINQDQVSNLTFNSYSTWNYFPGNIASLNDVCITLKGKPVFTTGYGTSAKAYIEHDSTLIQTGYLDTGRCRFNTIEPKLFKYFSVRTPSPLQGNLNVTVLDDTGGITNYITYGPTLDPGTEDIATPIPGGPRNWQALRFTLSRGTDVTKGAVMNSWQVKALPGVLRQRLITRQFLCFNEERDKGGNLNKGDTLSLDRLTSIRQMCQSGDTVTLQDLAQDTSTQVIIDDYQFTMMAPPGPNKENFGGYLTVVFRTVADAVPARPLPTPEGD